MEIEQLKNELRPQIADSIDYTLFDEIIGCLKEGYFRSAYIVSWIAIAENLKKKIQNMAELGDRQAAASLKVIDDAESKKASVDKMILTEAQKISLVDTHELHVLEYLWGNRSIYAHPYNLAPSIDETIYIVRHLVAICLSKPLLYKKAFLTRWIEDMVKVPHFLPEDAEQIKLYSDSFLLRVTPELHPFLFKTLLAELGAIVDDNAKVKIKVRLRNFLYRLLDSSPIPLSDAKWAIEQRAVDYPYPLIFGCLSASAWKGFSPLTKNRLIDYALAETDPNRLFIIKSRINYVVQANVLEPTYLSRYIHFLNATAFSSAVQFYGNKSELNKRIIAELDSNIFTSQNPVFEFIRDDAEGTFTQGLSEDEQISLGKSIMRAVIRGNYIGQTYFKELHQKVNLPKDVVYGMIHRTLFDREDFQAKLDDFVTALKILSRFGEVQGGEALDRILTHFDSMNDKKHYRSGQEIDVATSQLTDLNPVVLEKAQEILEKLREFIITDENLRLN